MADPTENDDVFVEEMAKNIAHQFAPWRPWENLYEGSDAISVGINLAPDVFFRDYWRGFAWAALKAYRTSALTCGKEKG